jgi:hypothetical protein
LNWIKREAISNDGGSVEADLGLRSGVSRFLCKRPGFVFGMGWWWTTL